MNEKQKIDQGNLIALAAHRKEIEFYEKITDKQWKKFLKDYLNQYYQNQSMYYSKAKITGLDEVTINREMKHEYVRLTYRVKFEDGDRCIHEILLNKRDCFPSFLDAHNPDDYAVVIRLWREFLVAEFPDEIRPVMQELKAKKKVAIDEQYTALDKEFADLV